MSLLRKGLSRLSRRSTGAASGQQLSLFEQGQELRPLPGGELRPLQRRAETATRFVVLGSGSAGNSVLVQGPKGSLLIDAGFSCRNLEQRMKAAGADPHAVKAILLTHEHGDHCRGVRQFIKRYRLKIYGTPRTFLGKAVRRIEHEEVVLDRPFAVAGLEIIAFPVPHDAQDPVGYVLEDPSGARLGIASDLGRLTARSRQALLDLDALIIESNHDPHMLETGPYPFALKRRVASRTGHLSNGDAAHGVGQVLSDRLHTVVPYHLSRTNNRKELAIAALKERLDLEGARGVKVVLSDQLEPSQWVDLRGPDRRPAGPDGASAD